MLSTYTTQESFKKNVNAKTNKKSTSFKESKNSISPAILTTQALKRPSVNEVDVEPANREELEVSSNCNHFIAIGH